MIGKTLDGRYRIASVLGEGGMGKVYLAEHVVLQKRMAVKVLHEEFSRSEDLVKRFEQEAIAASRIGQENIVNVTDFGRTPDGALFFVMEELQGESLASVLRRQGAMPVARALPILVQVCRALAAAHARGIVHRDLKPDNVMLLQREDRPDFVKVLDFGISKVGSSEAGNGARLTRAGMVMGTPEYMAPEQAAGTTVDHRADIYSLGAMAYEMMTGTLPFTAEHPLKLLMMHQMEPVEPLRSRKPELNIPEDLERTILRAMAKAPEARQASVSELMAELGPCMERQGLKAPTVPPIWGTPTGATVRPTPHTLPLEPTLVPGTPLLGLLGASKRRGPVLVVGGGALVLLVLGGALLLGGSHHQAAVGAPPALAAAVVPAAAPAHAPPPATPTGPRLKRVALVSAPQGAVVYDGDARVGVTPLSLELREGEQRAYRLVLAGYRPELQVVDTGRDQVRVELEKLHKKGGAKRTGRSKGRGSAGDDDLMANPF